MSVPDTYLKKNAIVRSISDYHGNAFKIFESGHFEIKTKDNVVLVLDPDQARMLQELVK